jgi:preprotein translocase subunit SecB
MKVENQVSLNFYGVNIVDLNFKSYLPFKADENKVSINIDPKVFYPKDSPNNFNIILAVAISAENFFELSFLAVGDFRIETQAIEQIKRQFINTNAPAIMFPYLRSFISTLTANLGSTGTITIPPQFFSGNLPELSEEDLPNS